jgi:fermentation-respiration switch protein FrsA (DUF1100 family)
MAFFFKSQRSLLYLRHHSYIPLSKANANPALREFPVTAEDGIALKGWYAPATSKPFTIVFFHGNGDSLYGAAHVADPYIAAGYGFLVTEYRGYSGLPGEPTEQGLYADGRAYMHGLIAQGVKPENVILFGHSLGTGVATQLTQEFNAAGLMLLAPFLSIQTIARLHFPFFPVSLLALDRYENFSKIGKIRAPLMIANGTRDEVIPPSQGRELYDLAHAPREFRSIPDRGHNDLFDDFAPLSMDWIERTCGKAGQGGTTAGKG